MGQKLTLKKEEENKVIYLVGSANTGKSAMFHLLTGKSVVISNFPGTTVKFQEGKMKLGKEEIKVYDTPGIYSLAGISEEEKITLRMILENRPDLIVHIMDATRLEKCLSLQLQIADFGIPTMVALNMIDEAERLKLRIDVEGLSKKLGVPIIPTVAVTGVGKKELIKTALEEMNKKEITPNHVYYDERTELEVEKIIHLLRRSEVKTWVPLRTMALWLLMGNEVIEETVMRMVEKEASNLEVV